MKYLCIYCAGGVGSEVLDIAIRCNTVNKRWQEIIFIDDICEENYIGKIRVFSYDIFLKFFPLDLCEIVIANGEPKVRKILFDKILGDKLRLATLIDPNAQVSSQAKIGEGVVIYPFVCVSPNAILEENNLVYYHSVIAHDSIVKLHSVLSIRATIAGHCIVGEGCFIGAGATIREGVSVGAWTIISMEAAVFHDVESFAVYQGNPAKFKRENKLLRVFK